MDFNSDNMLAIGSVVKLKGADILAMISSAYRDGVISKTSYEIMTKKYNNSSNGRTNTGGGAKGTTLNLQLR